MKLFINSASPYARKVRIVVREKGLLDQAEEFTTAPVDSHPDLTAANPLSQIPTMIDNNGVHWTDSSLIAARLDALSPVNALLPAGPEELWAVRRLEVLGSGLCEMLVKMVLERRRSVSEQSPFWLKRWEDNLMRGFAVADGLCPAPGTLDLATITLVIAATYTDFRYPHLDWRALAPKVAALQTELEKRPSFVDTSPK